MWYLPAVSAGKGKFVVRWKEGLRLRIRAESGEFAIGTREGAVKAPDVRRRPESGGTWSKDDFDEFVGVPWDPYAGT